jgi:hypothetical protein
LPSIWDLGMKLMCPVGQRWTYLEGMSVSKDVSVTRGLSLHVHSLYSQPWSYKCDLILILNPTL